MRRDRAGWLVASGVASFLLLTGLAIGLIEPPDRTAGPDAFDTVLLAYASALARVAVYQADSGRPDTAATLLRRVVLIRERLLVPDHPDLVEAQRRHAELTGKPQP